MRSIHALAGLGALAALATPAVIPAGPALAAPPTLTVTVVGGGALTGTAGVVVLQDGANFTIRCNTVGAVAASTLAANIPNARYPRAPAPVKIGTTAQQTFNNCAGVVGVLGAATITPAGEPYDIAANSTTDNFGETYTSVSPVNFVVNIPGPGCSFVITNAAPGYYTNAHNTLTLTPTPPVPPLVAQKPLTIGGVLGCGGKVKNGDIPTLTATYNLLPAGLTITATAP